MPGSAWDPLQYERFREQRAQPYRDLASLVEPAESMRVADLGCGTGELTAWLHAALDARETTGIDSSETMLAEAAPRRHEALLFQRADIRTWTPAAPPDLIFSNAALQWVEHHEELWPRLAGLLAAGGQIAAQMPVSDDHPSHTVARELAGEPPYRDRMAGYERPFPVLPPERYAEMLFTLGFERRLVRLQVYEHLLPSVDSVVSWMEGSLLTPFRERLAGPLYERLLGEYARRLRAHGPDSRPYLFPFKRLFVWGRLPTGRVAASAATRRQARPMRRAASPSSRSGSVE